MSKTVVITGASSGIGRATAVRMAASGHVVFAAARRADRLAELAASAAGAGGRIVPVALDVRDPDSVDAARRQVEGQAPDGVDVLVNNAGYSLIGPVETLAADDVRDQFETNVLGLLSVTRAFLPGMRARRSGRVVNISSVLGRITLPGTGVYSASKFAVEALSDALRLELGPLGVRIVLVEPGFTDTEIDTTPRAGSELVDYAGQIRAMTAFTQQQSAGGVSAEAVAAVIERAATATRPRARYLVTRRDRATVRAVGSLPTRVTDRVKAVPLRKAATGAA